MTLKAKYELLQQQLTAIEKATGVYLADESVDYENVLEGKSIDVKELVQSGWVDANDPIWFELYQAACMAAGMRSEDAGIDINILMGRNIY